MAYATSVDSGQSAPEGAVWSGSTLFAIPLRILRNTLQPLYNTIRYNTDLDITRFKDGSQKCIDYIEKWP